YTKDDENTQKYIKERFVHKDENGRLYMKSPIQSPNYRSNLIYDYKGYKTPKKGYSVSREVLEKWDREGKLVFPKNKDQNINRKIYLDEYKGQPVSSLWSDIYVINPMSKERTNFSSGQKPEALIKRIFEMVTEENDLILDFFMGSSTTQAVAMKMNRRFVGIEQMDYMNEISVPRLNQVINGDQGGISKETQWQGGGSFVYAELYSLNEELVNKIQVSQDSRELNGILQEMKAKAYLNFKVDLEKMTSNNSGFYELSLQEQKDILIQVLDMN